MKTTVTTLEFGGVTYTAGETSFNNDGDIVWGDRRPCWRSHERGVTAGNLRLIDGAVNFAVSVCEGGWRKPDSVVWVAVPAPVTETPSKKARK